MKKDILKRVMLLVTSFLLCFAIGGQVANAASAKTSYKVKRGSNELESKLKVKGTQTKKIKLTVKEKGTLKVVLDGTSVLGKNEQVKVSLVNQKGKTISTTKATKQKRGFVSYYVKPGTYKLVVTTKNIKKSKTRTMRFSYTMNKELTLKANNKPMSDISDKKGNFSFKFVNDKDQVVRIWNQKSSDGRYSVYDSKGKLVYELVDNEWTGPSVHYLKKGTYQVKVSEGSGQAYTPGKFVVTPQNALTSNLTTNASSKEKAVVYNGKAVNFVFYGRETDKCTQWLKVDTSKEDVNLWMTCPGDDEDQYRTDYSATVSNEKGEVSKYYEYRGYGVFVKDPNGKWDYETSRCIRLKKGTGVHYIAVTTCGTAIATLAPEK